MMDENFIRTVNEITNEFIRSISQLCDDDRLFANTLIMVIGKIRDVAGFSEKWDKSLVGRTYISLLTEETTNGK